MEREIRMTIEIPQEMLKDFRLFTVLHGGKIVATENKITKSQAKEFYRDLCGTAYGNSNKTCGGIMSTEHIADLMKITVDRATEFINAMLEYGITERQGGAIVV